MSYEWDSKRARRAHLTKKVFGLLSAAILVMIPVWFALSIFGS